MYRNLGLKNKVIDILPDFQMIILLDFGFKTLKLSLHLKRHIKTIKAKFYQEQGHCSASRWQHRASVVIEAILIEDDVKAKHITGRIQISQALKTTLIENKVSVVQNIWQNKLSTLSKQILGKNGWSFSKNQIQF